MKKRKIRYTFTIFCLFSNKKLCIAITQLVVLCRNSQSDAMAFVQNKMALYFQMFTLYSSFMLITHTTQELFKI